MHSSTVKYVKWKKLNFFKRVHLRMNIERRACAIALITLTIMKRMLREREEICNQLEFLSKSHGYCRYCLRIVVDVLLHRCTVCDARYCRDCLSFVRFCTGHDVCGHCTEDEETEEADRTYCERCAECSECHTYSCADNAFFKNEISYVHKHVQEGIWNKARDHLCHDTRRD
jgi:hypothetical protein